MNERDALADKVKQLYDIIDNRNAEITHLHAALHDAINSPKGVVPESAERLYVQDYYDKKAGSD